MTTSTTDPIRIVWHWKSNYDPWSSKPEEAEWKRYSDAQNVFIEQAFMNKQQQIELSNYLIDLEHNVQIRKGDKHKQRPIKRVEINDATQYLRDERFFFPEKPVKSFSTAEKFGSEFVSLWGKKNETLLVHKSFDEIVEQAADGILKEGKKINEDFEAETIAKQLRTIKDQEAGRIRKLCVKIYSAECFLYKLVNKTLRESDFSKINTLGAFCYLLWQHTYFSCDDTYAGTVYRGAQLNQTIINVYQEAVGTEIKWLAFSSTSKNPQQAEKFGNTLFVIQLKYYDYKDISSISNYPIEEEVLLPAGTNFTVDRVECHHDGKYLIFLTTAL